MITKFIKYTESGEQVDESLRYWSDRIRGIELIRLLQHHPHMHVASVHSSSQAGVSLHDVYPHIEERFVLRDIRSDDIEGELVFLATPPGVSSEWTPKLLAAGHKVIDLSGDFRLRDGNVYAKWYKNATE